MKKYFAKLVPIGVISFKMAGSYFFSEPADIGHVISKYFATKPVNDSEGDEIP